jgi:hypothetical protein
MRHIHRRSLLIASAAAACLPACLPAKAAAATVQAALWPHTITMDGASVTVYEPQAISWPDEKRLTARAALAIAQPGKSQPLVGTVEVAYATQVDAATRTVSLSDPQVLATHFPTLDTTQATQLQARIGAALPQVAARPLPLAAVLGSLKQPPAVPSVAVSNDPPTIFHSTGPASLVVFDGPPVMAPVGSTGISFAVNTNWQVFTDPAGTWYLLDGKLWLSAPAATGPYKPTTTVPAAFKTVAAQANFSDLRAALPPHAPAAGSVPTVFVSTKPAEIIAIDGAPQFAAIPGTGLQYVRNTDAQLFLYPSTGQYYYLTSGRWFSASGLDGPWQFGTGSLPPDFSLIPPDSPKASVLASVPGTAAAQQAVLAAQLPQQGTLSRATAKIDVTYAGTPAFKPIPATSLTYATNTSYQVIGAEGRYYACYQGAWFVAPAPTGPWVLADTIPAAIYTIPPTSPLYNVTYVRVYAATPVAVTYGFTAGYALGFVTAGILAFGTGFYYPPVVVAGRLPAFFPYPYSYAGGIAYNSVTGTWARGGAVYGPYGGARGGVAYNPATGGYARGGAVYGPYGGAGAYSAYNPRTGTYSHGTASWGPDGGTAHVSAYNPRTGVGGSTTQHANAYGRWGSSQVSGPNRTVDTASASNRRGAVGGSSSSTGAQGVGVHGARGNNAAVIKGSGGDTYGGADGNVYKHSDSGWQKYGNGGWNDVQKPAAGRTDTNFSQLDQDRQARTLGAQQQRGWGGGGGGGWRGGGGDYGGGGRRFR